MPMRRGFTALARPATRMRPRWGIVGALICLLAQGAGFAHLALVRHATCAEHDALVHAPVTDTALLAALGMTGPPASAAALAGTARGVPAHEDDHCLVAGLRRRDLLPVLDEGPTLLASPLPCRCPVAGAEARKGPVPLLHLAPKSSPPGAPV